MLKFNLACRFLVPVYVCWYVHKVCVIVCIEYEHIHATAH